MKYIILILFINSIACCSQKVPEQSLTRENWILPNDTFSLDNINVFDLTDSGSNPTIGFLTVKDYDIFNNKSQSDTVKVIMLVCDTSVTKNLNVYNPLNIEPNYHNNLCYWQYGYEVCDKEFTQPFIFLDEYKKPLSKNIIVWQTKSL